MLGKFWLPSPSFVCDASINPPIIISFGRLNWAKSKGLSWVVFNFHRHIIIYYQSKKMVETEIVDPITMQRNATQGSKQRKPYQNSNFGLRWFSEYVELFPALHWLVLKVTKLNYFLDIIDLQQYSLGSLTYVRQFLKFAPFACKRAPDSVKKRVPIPFTSPCAELFEFNQITSSNWIWLP